MKNIIIPVRHELTVFFAILTVLCGIFYTLIVSAGTLQAAGGLYTLGLMWSPGISALITQRVFRGSLEDMGWKPGKIRFLVISYVLPLLYGLPIYAAVWLILPQEVVWSAFPSIFFIVVFATWGVLIGCLSAAGEEIGWRGFLAPRLAARLGYKRSSLLMGIIWAVYHMPAVILADYNAKGAPIWFGLLCFTILVMGITFAFNWLRLASGSVWTAVLLHASHNLYIQGVFDPTVAGGTYAPYITGEFGAGVALGGVIVGLVFWKLRDRLFEKEPAAVPTASQEIV